MSNRILGPLAAAVLLLAPRAWAQGAGSAKEPVSDGRTLSEWVGDLKDGAAPQTIKALDDPEATVRFPVLVALGEIGPAAKAAVPKLQQMMDEEINDEIAAAAKRALKRIQPEAVKTD